MSEEAKGEDIGGKLTFDQKISTISVATNGKGGGWLWMQFKWQKLKKSLSEYDDRK